MHKFISKNLEIDLSEVQLTINEENNWFSDRFFSKYSYPFTLQIKESMYNAIGDLVSFNSKLETYIEGEYVFYDKMEKAILIVDEIEGSEVTFSLRYGYDEFPGFEKKLSEFEWEVISVNDIYQYANNIVGKVYPATHFNFPQIIVDKYNNEDTQWKYFQGRLNNRKSGLFLKNEVSSDVEPEHHNRNIIQPLVYLKHVVIKGFESQGYQVTGDFFQDNLISKILLYSSTDYFQKPDISPLTLDVSTDEDREWETTFKGVTDGNWKKSLEIPIKGRYKIIGSITLEGVAAGRVGGFGLYFNDTIIKTGNYGKKVHITIDTVIDAVHPTNFIELSITSVFNPNTPEVLVQLQVLPLYYLNSAGGKQPSIINTNEIDLKRALPDLTFGELMTAVITLFNLDFDVKSDIVELNSKQTKIKKSKTHDFRKFEVAHPFIGFKTGEKILLEYQEDGEDKILEKVLFESTGISVINPNTDVVSTEEISINAFPLSFQENTVKDSSDNRSNLNLVLYSGLSNDNNYALPPDELLMPSISSNYHQEWLESRVRSRMFNPGFNCKIEDIISLKIKDKIFMYNNYHLIKNISKNQISKDLYEVEMNTETIED